MTGSVRKRYFEAINSLVKKAKGKGIISVKETIQLIRQELK